MVPRPHRALNKYLAPDILVPLAMPWYVEKPIFCNGVGWFLGAKIMKKGRVLFFATRLPDASRIIPGVPQVLPGTPGQLLWRSCHIFRLLVFFKIRPKNVMVLGGSVGAAVGPESESFLLPEEECPPPGHTRL